MFESIARSEFNHYLNITPYETEPTWVPLDNIQSTEIGNAGQKEETHV